MEKLSFVENIR